MLMVSPELESRIQGIHDDVPMPTALARIRYEGGALECSLLGVSMHDHGFDIVTFSGPESLRRLLLVTEILGMDIIIDSITTLSWNTSIGYAMRREFTVQPTGIQAVFSAKREDR